MATILLTPAQRSALECAGLELCDESPEDKDLRLLAAAWYAPTRLRVTDETRDALFSALTDRSNAEDALAEERGDKAARGAALALANLSSKVLRG